MISERYRRVLESFGAFNPQRVIAAWILVPGYSQRLKKSAPTPARNSGTRLPARRATSSTRTRAKPAGELAAGERRRLRLWRMVREVEK